MGSEVVLSRPVAPEDISGGDFVCVMQELKEYLPIWSFFQKSCDPPELIRIHWLPEDAGTPLRVVEVCVPFVLVEQVDGQHRTLDLRRCRLARVSERFGERAFKRLRRQKARVAMDDGGV